MRKRTISHFADTVFWYLLYALPILMYLVNAINNPTVGFSVFMRDTLGFVYSSSNPIYVGLNDLFGASGILPFFSSDGALYLVTWFACMLIVHLFVDFVLWIPRLAHKWLNSFCKGDE